MRLEYTMLCQNVRYGKVKTLKELARKELPSKVYKLFCNWVDGYNALAYIHVYEALQPFLFAYGLDIVAVAYKTPKSVYTQYRRVVVTQDRVLISHIENAVTVF